MKSTLCIFAVLLGMAMASDGKALIEKEEGRLFGVGLLSIIATLVQLGVSIVILIALINLVHTLKGAIDFDSLFGKGGDDYGYDYAPSTGYGVAPATGYAAPVGDGSSYSSYRRAGEARAFKDLPVMQRLSAKVSDAIEKFTE